tara:strand:+ start:451 stop:702 length:252 start_codon:yes stop_codon:yes gene_type:complete
MREKIIEYYSDSEPVTFADGIDKAIIGFDPNSWQVVYSRNKVIELLQEREEMTEEEAIDYAEYNIFNAYVGERTPVWAEVFSW